MPRHRHLCMTLLKGALFALSSSASSSLSYHFELAVAIAIASHAHLQTPSSPLSNCHASQRARIIFFFFFHCHTRHISLRFFTERENMLAIFSDAIAHGPDALSSPGSAMCSSSELAAKFQLKHPQLASIGFEGNSHMAYTHEKQALLTPRTFSAVDDIFCIFEGVLENLPVLRQRYGLSKSVNEALLVIEAYRALRDRAPYPPDQVVGDLSGHFAFVLYDNCTKKIFVAADMFGKVPLFWGTTSDGLVAFSDDVELIKSTCGRSIAVFPQGCYFSSDEGLRSFEHPLQEVTAVPQLDSQGQAYGSTFKVDFERSLSRDRTSNISPWAVV